MRLRKWLVQIDFPSMFAPGLSANRRLSFQVDTSSVGKKITQRNCQTWILESADQLVKDGIFDREVAAYLHAIRQ